MVVMAACQTDIELGAVSANGERLMETLWEAAEEGVQLAVFPELSLTGYRFDSTAAVEAVALTEDSALLAAIDRLCQRLGIIAVVGFIERVGVRHFNCAGIFGQGSPFPRYRKVHLPALGADRFLDRGDLGFPVFDLPCGRIGINICYDLRFPEAARVPAVGGAQVIVVPTNESLATHELSGLLIRARAYENRVYCLWSNRVGTENGTDYTGMSQIVDPVGETLVLAASGSVEIVRFDLDPTTADDKTIPGEPDGSDMHLINDRVPEGYRPLVEPVNHRSD